MARAGTQEHLRSRLATSGDRRVLRTRTALVAAYRSLLDAHEPATASEVAARAGVTRSSFYAHFADLDELAAATLAEHFASLVDSARSAVLAGDATRVANERSFLDLARFLDDHRDTYGALLAHGGAVSAALARTMADLNLETLRGRARVHDDPEVVAHFLAGGVVAVLGWWLRADADEPRRSPEALARALIAVTPRDFAG